MTLVRKTAQLGEVVAAAFDKAARYSCDPKVVSRLATKAIALILRPERRGPPPSRWPSFSVGDPL
jgi:hypothetical protein